MDQNSLYTVLITIVTVLSSASAWRYYEKRAENKEKTDNINKNDIRTRINKLETTLEKEVKENNSLNSNILTLTSEISKLKTKCEYLEKDNKRLNDTH